MCLTFIYSEFEVKFHVFSISLKTSSKMNRDSVDSTFQTETKVSLFNEYEACENINKYVVKPLEKCTWFMQFQRGSIDSLKPLY